MASPSVPAQSGRRPRSLLPWILGGVCALIALIVGIVVIAGSIWYFALRETPQSVVEDYLVAWNETDCERYEEITTERVRGDGYTCELWRAEVDRQLEEGYLFEHAVTGSEVDGERATVRVEETMTHDGESARHVFEIVLTKESGDWLITDFVTIEAPEEI
ncbi:MAG: Rv0361 family membrane protein [Brachybacterium sp.]